MKDEEVLGTTKISPRWRISLISDVREAFEEQGYEIEEGDKVLYRLEDGRIIVEPNWSL